MFILIEAMSEGDIQCDCSCCVWPQCRGVGDDRGGQSEPATEEMVGGSRHAPFFVIVLSLICFIVGLNNDTVDFICFAFIIVLEIIKNTKKRFKYLCIFFRLPSTLFCDGDKIHRNITCQGKTTR